MKETYYSRNREKCKKKAKAEYQRQKAEGGASNRALARYYRMKQEDPERLAEISKKAKAKAVKRKRAIVDKIKADKGCAKCKERNPRKLDFHHKELKGKRSSVSEMVKDQAPDDRMLQEILKCSVLCKDCHTALHRVNWLHDENETKRWRVALYPPSPV